MGESNKQTKQKWEGNYLRSIKSVHLNKVCGGTQSHLWLWRTVRHFWEWELLRWWTNIYGGWSMWFDNKNKITTNGFKTHATTNGEICSMYCYILPLERIRVEQMNRFFFLWDTYLFKMRARTRAAMMRLEWLPCNTDIRVLGAYLWCCFHTVMCESVCLKRV